MAEDEFLSDYYGQRPLHLGGRPDKAGDVFSWERFERMLAMTDIWTAATLKLYLDRREVPPQAYCVPTVDRNQVSVMQPVPARVMELINRGASVICNQVETLDPGILGVMHTLEQAFKGRGSCNLYCSWQGIQAFDSHYDKHEVFALHIAGEKTWRLYEGRIDRPIHHESFPPEPQAQLDAKKGKVSQEVTLQPGDLLYIPRGQFHDALATGQASLHLTFSLNVPNGLNALTALWNAAARDPVFRGDLPIPLGEDHDARMQAYLQTFKERLVAMVDSPEFGRQVRDLQAKFPVSRGGYDLPPMEGKPKSPAGKSAPWALEMGGGQPGKAPAMAKKGRR